MLAIMSGARQGELLGLKWTDIDWQNNQLHIERTFNKGRWFAPKTRCSNRRVDLGPMMMKALKEWRLACHPNEQGLIFPNNAGQPMNYSNMVQRYYFPALKAAGIPRMKFHSLRHTTAKWEVVSAKDKKVGDPVFIGDNLHLKIYGGKSYLDACGHDSCSTRTSRLYSVVTNFNKNRDELDSAKWSFEN